MSSPGRNGCSRSRTRPTSPHGSRRCSARSICCSTKAITARRPRRRCAPSCVGRRCGSPACCSSLPGGARPPPTAPRGGRGCTPHGRRRGARLPARLDAAGQLSVLAEQDRSRWDAELMAEGQRLLERSARGAELTEYHVEAAIAAVHASAPRLEDTDWGQIVSLYDMLLAIRPSPVVALNRAIAVAQRDGPERGLAAIAAIADRDRLAGYPFYHAALGELELRRGQGGAARAHFAAALTLARNAMERHFLEQRMEACDVAPAPVERLG